MLRRGGGVLRRGGARLGTVDRRLIMFFGLGCMEFSDCRFIPLIFRARERERVTVMSEKSVLVTRMRMIVIQMTFSF